MPVGRIILKSISESKKISKLKTDGARLLYTWLITHLDVNGCYSGDPQVINGKVFTRLNRSNKTIEDYLKDLEQNKLIIRYWVNSDTFLNVPDFVDKQPSLNPNREGKTNIPLPNPELLQSNSGFTPPKVKLSKDKLNINKDKLNNVEQIISYLNKRADKNFKANTKTTIGKIKARINEGYILDDFKKVIDIKTAKWKTDPKMSDYLRPETLFGNKFESYLNEKIIKKPDWRTK